MTGKELVDLITKADMLDKEIDADRSKLTFSLFKHDNPVNEDAKVYVTYVIDFYNKTGYHGFHHTY